MALFKDLFVLVQPHCSLFIVQVHFGMSLPQITSGAEVQKIVEKNAKEQAREELQFTVNPAQAISHLRK